MELYLLTQMKTQSPISSTCLQLQQIRSYIHRDTDMYLQITLTLFPYSIPISVFQKPWLSIQSDSSPFMLIRPQYVVYTLSWNLQYVWQEFSPRWRTRWFIKQLLENNRLDNSCQDNSQGEISAENQMSLTLLLEPVMQQLWNSFGVQGTSENLVQSAASAKQKTEATHTSTGLAYHKAGKCFKCKSHLGTSWVLPIAIFYHMHIPGKKHCFPCTEDNSR